MSKDTINSFAFFLQSGEVIYGNGQTVGQALANVADSLPGLDQGESILWFLGKIVSIQQGTAND